jgi:hypothetical protein
MNFTLRDNPRAGRPNFLYPFRYPVRLVISRHGKGTNENETPRRVIGGTQKTDKCVAASAMV